MRWRRWTSSRFTAREPANFLDVGGGASTEKVAAAFRILLADKRVKGVLINIFGGIMRCDVLAQGVVEAAKQVKLNVPLVVRMEGTNVVEGKKILAESGIKVIAADGHGRRRQAHRASNRGLGISDEHFSRQEHPRADAGNYRRGGQLHTRACKEYGTKMVGGVVPGKGGTDFEGIPVFDTVEQARKATGCNATVIYVPPAFAADAMLEAVAAGIELVICITEGIPSSTWSR